MRLLMNQPTDAVRNGFWVLLKNIWGSIQNDQKKTFLGWHLRSQHRLDLRHWEEDYIAQQDLARVSQAASCLLPINLPFQGMELSVGDSWPQTKLVERYCDQGNLEHYWELGTISPLWRYKVLSTDFVVAWKPLSTRFFARTFSC